MLSLASARRILVHPGKTDMRLGVRGLSAMAGRTADGELHAFCSGDRKTVRILLREGPSLWLLTKRLESGRFQWPSGPGPVSEAGIIQLQWLLDGPASMLAMEGRASLRERPGL